MVNFRKFYKPIPLVKSHGLFIYGINDDRIYRRDFTCINNSFQRIDQQDFTDILSLFIKAYCQLSDQCSRYYPSVREFSCLSLRQLANIYPCIGKAIETRNTAWLPAHQHKHTRKVSTLILCGQILKVGINIVISARKSRSVMMLAERFKNGGRRCIHSTSLRYRVAAAFNASLGAGGLESASKKTIRSSSASCNCSASSIAFCAALKALKAIKSVRLRPETSAARTKTLFMAEDTRKLTRSSLRIRRSLVASSVGMALLLS